MLGKFLWGIFLVLGKARAYYQLVAYYRFQKTFCLKGNIFAYFGTKVFVKPK